MDRENENKNTDYRNNVVETFENLPLTSIQENCYVPTAVKGTTSNLVEGYTPAQALENVRLLVLNIPTSTNKNYDADYPDQEFDSLISVFNILFSPAQNGC